MNMIIDEKFINNEKDLYRENFIFSITKKKMIINQKRTR